ncbi:MAG: DUF4179 domain-containing protein [Oscillospiraceae bacterium]
MRNIDERFNIVKMRAKELKQAKRQRDFRILSLCSVTCCLLLIVGTSFAMPNVMSQLSETVYTGVIGFASIFSKGTSMGYLIVALLGFTLGICLTLLCAILHKRSVEDKNNDRNS